MNNQPIGIIDSGIGGLTVAKVLHEKYPHENILFVGDTARNPYGERPKEQIVHFADALKNYLLSQKVKMILVACNTISFSVPPEYFRSDIPVIGMSLELPPLPDVHEIAVFGTPATIGTHIHRKKILAEYPRVKVDEVPCEGLAHAIETGRPDAEKEDLLRKAVREYGAEHAEAGWYACTHYPLISSIFQKTLPQARFYDPAEPTVAEGMKQLKEKNRSGSSRGSCTFCFTGSTAYSGPLTKRLFGPEAAVREIILPGV